MFDFTEAVSVAALRLREYGACSATSIDGGWHPTASTTA